MDLIEVVTGILPHLVTESNNNLCLGGGALNYAMQNTPEGRRNCLDRTAARRYNAAPMHFVFRCLFFGVLLCGLPGRAQEAAAPAGEEVVEMKYRDPQAA